MNIKKILLININYVQYNKQPHQDKVKKCNIDYISCFFVNLNCTSSQINNNKKTWNNRIKKSIAHTYTHTHTNCIS